MRFWERMKRMKYEDFLKGKLKSRPKSGFDMQEKHENLFEWQRYVTDWACKTGSAALFEDCGLGKTAQQLAWAQETAQKTGRPTLILAPLAVSRQTVREGEKFGVPVTLAEMDADIAPGVNITNYEKLDKFDTSKFGAVVLDESSILKSYMGKTKRQIIGAFRDTPFKLACTATPAPNDLMELLNHAEFLGIMRSSEALSCWFVADQRNSGHYRLKGHAEHDFWRWVASWAVCISSPKDIGFDDTGYVLPELHEKNEVVQTEQSLLALTEKLDLSVKGFHAAKKKSLAERVQRCAEIVVGSDEQFVVWCFQNEEADELKKAIPGAVEIRGSDKADAKERAAVDFIDGKYRVLISKPSIFGFGLNFQNCRNAVFCGLDYSYESYYQAVRRFYRFGQDKEVNVWRVIGEGEKEILDAIERKAQQKKEMTVSMAQAMREFQTEAVRGREFVLDLKKDEFKFPAWIKEAV